MFFFFGLGTMSVGKKLERERKERKEGDHQVICRDPCAPVCGAFIKFVLSHGLSVVLISLECDWLLFNNLVVFGNSRLSQPMEFKILELT